MKHPYKQNASTSSRRRYWQPFILYSVILGAVTLAFFGPDLWRANQPYRNCRANPSATCLVDLGLSQMDKLYRLPATSIRAVTQLSRMARYDAARALSVRRAVERGEAPHEAGITADKQIARHKLAAALNAGMPLKQALREIPYASDGIWIAALSFAGRNPFGAPFQTKLPVSTAKYEIISQLADEMLRQARQLEPERQNRPLVYAANIHAMIGDKQAALKALSYLQATERNFFSLSDELARLIGSKEVLAAYKKANDTSPYRYFKALEAKTTPAETDVYLRASYATFATHKPWPKFGKMLGLVQLAMGKGRDDLALELAHEMVLAAQNTSSPFKIFVNIDTANALFAARATSQEVYNSLTIAQNLFPNNNSLVGIGLISGPMFWQKSGLKAEAIRSIAQLYARLGDIAPVRSLMREIEQPRFAWANVLSSDIATQDLDQMLDWADEALDDAAMAYVKAQLAAQIFRQELDPQKRDWAWAQVSKLLNAPLLLDDRAAQTYTSILRVTAAQDTDMQQKALRRLADSALARRDFPSLIAAALEWHLAPPEF